MSNSHIALPAVQVNDQALPEIAIARPCPLSSYVEKQLATEHIGQLLWAAHTIANGRRKNGAARSTWLILYTCWADGVWRYHPEEHCLTRHLNGDVRRALADAACNRWFIAQAPCVFVVSTVPRRGTRERFGERWHVCHSPIEAGRAVERMFLQCTALGLASVPVSEFDSARAKHTLILSRQEEPLCLMPVGWPDQGC